MRVRNVARSKSEVRTDGILRAALAKRGYRVERNMRVSDVVEFQGQELTEREMHCYRTMHFDFTITQGDCPRFVVEFDGPHHMLNSTVAHLDAVKNDLCHRVELPILRVSSRELEQNERVSLLAWMLERWTAWQTEGPVLQREVNAERGRLLRAGMHPGEVTDPSFASAEFYFDLNHPYPAVLTVATRLHRLGIITLHAGDDLVARLAASRVPGHLAQCIALPAGEGPEGAASRYVDYEAEVRRWQPGQTSIDLAKEPILYTTSERVVWRWALPIGWEAPSVLASEPDVARFEDRVEWWIKAMGYLWTCDLPGAPSHQVAEGLAEYLVLRNVEQWALQNRDGAGSCTLAPG